MQSANLCKVQIYAKCKTMQNAKKIQNLDESQIFLLERSHIPRRLWSNDHRFQDVAATTILLKESRVDVTFLIPGL